MPAITDAPRAEEFVALVRVRLREKTYRHAVAVAKLMASLTETLGLDHEQAVYAGLLHDVEKDLNAKELIAAAERYGLCVTESQREKPKLLHGPVGAEYVRRELHVPDEAVYEAIYWHTTGRPNLGLLGQALYFADFAEPYREHPEAPEARVVLAREGFPAALRFVADAKLGYVLTRPPVDPTTAAFHAWLRTEPR